MQAGYCCAVAYSAEEAIADILGYLALPIAIKRQLVPKKITA
jgi:hypothetical protein